VNGEARKRNGNLPGMGGVFNLVNLHLYHYAGNNPVKYTDPDGREPKWATLGNAINLDFGKDYMDLASANFREGEYGWAAVMVVDGICEAAYDLFAAYLGSSVIGAFLSGSGATSVATSATGPVIVSATNKFGGNDLVIGLNNNGSLINWAQEFGGKTFGKFDSLSRSFAGQIKDAMTQATNIRVNLNGVDLNRINGILDQFGEPAAGYTNYELYLLKTVPEFLEKAKFYLDNVEVLSPF
jgi:hypothetical protein